MSRSTLALIVAFFPLAAGIAMVSLWDFPRASEQVVYTDDGRLIGLNKDWYGNEVNRLQVWDLTRRKKLLTYESGFSDARLSPDGLTLLVFDHEAATVIEVATQRVIREPVLGLTRWRDVAFSGNGDFLALFQFPNNTVQVWDVASWQSMGRVEVAPGSSAVAISCDGKTLAVGLESGVIELWDLDSQEHVETLRGFLSGKSLTFSPDGHSLASGNTHVRIWDLATGKQPMSFTPRMPPVDVVFSPDSSQLAVVHEAANTSVVDVQSTETIDDWQGLGLYFFGGVNFSPDGQSLAGAGPYGKARTMHLGTRDRVTVEPISPYFVTISSWVGGFYLVWSVAWILRDARHDTAFRPFWDLVLVWALLVSGLAMRVFGTGSIYDASRPVMQFGMACFVTLIAFVVIWAALGTARWSLRLPGLIGLCSVAMSPMLLWDDFDWFLWQTILGVISMIVTLLLLLKVSQFVWGVQLVQIASDDAVGSPADRVTSSQFTLLDLLLWTTAAALLIGVTMNFSPTSMPNSVWRFAVALGVGFALVAGAACWVALGDRSLRLRVVVLVILIVLAGSLQLGFRSLMLIAPRWTAMQPGIMAIFTTGSLLVFRMHGYRLSGRERRVID